MMAALPVTLPEAGPQVKYTKVKLSVCAHMQRLRSPIREAFSYNIRHIPL